MTTTSATATNRSTNRRPGTARNRFVDAALTVVGVLGVALGVAHLVGAPVPLPDVPGTPAAQAAQVGPVAEVAPAVPASLTEAQVGTVTAILTQPDQGPAGRTYRWTKTNLTVRIDLGGSSAALRPHVDAALAWVTASTGVTFTEVTGDADLTIGTQRGDGGSVVVHPNGDNSIRSAQVSLGCCRARVAFEEIGQAMGALGDHGGTDSIFSQSQVAVGPGPVDSAALTVLYQVPAGADAAAVAAVARGL